MLRISYTKQSFVGFEYHNDWFVGLSDIENRVETSGSYYWDFQFSNIVLTK